MNESFSSGPLQTSQYDLAIKKLHHFAVLTFIGFSGSSAPFQSAGLGSVFWPSLPFSRSSTSLSGPGKSFSWSSVGFIWDLMEGDEDDCWVADI